MKQQARNPGCEEHEIPIGHLSPGAVFVLDLGRRKRNGIVVSRNAGSVTVEWQDGAIQHCCVECPVVRVHQSLDDFNRKTTEEQKMKTKKKKELKSAEPKKRTASLAKYVDRAFEIFGKHNDKEVTGKVAANGVITVNDEEYFSPSLAIHGVRQKKGNGWTFWKFKRNGELVPLDALRGKSVRKTKDVKKTVTTVATFRVRKNKK